MRSSSGFQAFRQIAALDRQRITLHLQDSLPQFTDLLQSPAHAGVDDFLICWDSKEAALAASSLVGEEQDAPSGQTNSILQQRCICDHLANGVVP